MSFKELLQKVTLKHVLFGAMCVLLILVVVLFCMVGSRISNMFNMPEESTPPSTSETTLPSESTQPPTTETTVPPTTVPPPPETTLPTEPGHEHEFVLRETVSATCENYGYKIYACSCGKQDIPLDEQIEPYGHSYGAGQTVEATCEEDGCTQYTCSRCGNVDERNIVPAIGHNFLSVDTIPASCNIEGYTLYQCANCEMEEMRDLVPALEHEYQVIETKEATCTESGYTRSQCTNCLDTIDENVVPATGHTFSDWLQLTEVSWTRTCGHCGTVENSTDMVITNAQVSSDHVHDAQGKPYRMYLIYVGTPTTPDMVHYTINDYLDNGTLTYSYDVFQGLVINYTTSSGETATIVLPVLQSTIANIPADPAPADSEVQ